MFVKSKYFAIIGAKMKRIISGKCVLQFKKKACDRKSFDRDWTSNFNIPEVAMKCFTIVSSRPANNILVFVFKINDIKK